MKRLLAICLFCAASGAAFGASSELSRASEDLGAASAVVVGGSLSMLAASGQVVVASVEAAGEGSLVVLKGSADAGQASLRLSAQAARGLSLAAGTTVSVVALSTGYALVLAGKAIAYIPNEIGKSLLHHAPVQ